MKKKPFCILLSAAALMANGCASLQVAPSEAMGPNVYRISARATSRKILSETVKNAKEQCAQENKQYLFVKNIFQHSSNLGIDMASYDLYFTCVEAGDPRLNERKSLLRPAKEKAEEKPGESPDKEAAPAPEKLQPSKDDNQGQQETAAKISAEQLRKGDPGMGELENLRKDGSALYDDPEQNTRIIEEVLPGENSQISIRRQGQRRRSIKR